MRRDTWAVVTPSHGVSVGYTSCLSCLLAVIDEAKAKVLCQETLLLFCKLQVRILPLSTLPYPCLASLPSPPVRFVRNLLDFQRHAFCGCPWLPFEGHALIHNINVTSITGPPNLGPIWRQRKFKKCGAVRSHSIE